MWNKREKKTIITLIILLATAFLIFCYSLSIFIIVKTNKNKLEYQPITITTEHKVYNYLNNELNNPYTYQENNKLILRKELEELTNVNFYIYKGIDKSTIDNGQHLGITNFQFRYIKVAEKLSSCNYIWTLTHELLHLKYYNSNEMWTNFMTFKVLYESNNNDFERVAIVYGYRYVSAHTRNTDDEIINTNTPYQDYDISYYIIDYLNNINDL